MLERQPYFRATLIFCYQLSIHTFSFIVRLFYIQTDHKIVLVHFKTINRIRAHKLFTKVNKLNILHYFGGHLKRLSDENVQLDSSLFELKKQNLVF